MKRVYGSLDMVVASHFQSILEAEGIATLMKNEHLHMAMGEVPFTQCAPELCVVHDADFERALEILQPYYATVMRDPAHLPEWTCPGCLEKIEATFGSCWHCGEPQPTDAP